MDHQVDPTGLAGSPTGSVAGPSATARHSENQSPAGAPKSDTETATVVGMVSPPPAVAPSAATVAAAPAAAEDLPGLIRRVEQAATGWDIRADLPEGRFVSAIMAAVGGVGQLIEISRKDFTRQFDQNREAAKDELARAREITKAADRALSQARNAGLVLEVERENVVIRMIEKTLPMFIEKMEGVLTIRERRISADRQRRRYALIAAVTLVLFVGGYAVRSWQDVDATGFYAVCLTHLQKAGDRSWCDATAFAAGVR